MPLTLDIISGVRPELFFDSLKIVTKEIVYGIFAHLLFLKVIEVTYLFRFKADKPCTYAVGLNGIC